MAKVFIDTSAHGTSGGTDFATGWYRRGAPEPAGSRPLNIDDVIGISHMTFDALSDSIVANCAAGDDIIIVGHGGYSGLSMRLLPRSEARLRVEVATSLGRMEATLEPGVGTMPPTSASEAAVTCQIIEQQVQALRAKLARVRALRLRHVAFRACNMGNWEHTLIQFKPFFGCQEVSAPKLRDIYGILTPAITPDPAAWATGWMRQHPVNNHSYAYGRPNIVVATSGGQTDDHTIDVALAAASNSDLQAWLSRYLIATSAIRSLPYHGQVSTVGLAGSPRIYFAGDPGYLRNLTVC